MKWVIFNQNRFEEYNNFITKHKYTGIWHDPLWLKLQVVSERAIGGDIFAIKNHEKIVLAGIITIYNTALNIKYGYIQAGFLYNQIDKEIYDFFLENLKLYANKKNLIFTQIDSITPFEDHFYNTISNFKNHELNIKLPIPRYSNIIDLTLSEDEILKQMKPKGRYNIKVAQKNGLKSKIGNIDDIPIFYNLLKETGERDGFFLNNIDYYKKMIETLPYTKLILIYKDDMPLAGGIFSYFHNQALYYYGASSNNFRNLMAPYLMQWEAIRIGKELGCKFYDFMGIANPDDKNDKLAGVTDFKLKFGGNIVKFNNSYRIIHNNLLYFIYKTAKKIKK